MKYVIASLFLVAPFFWSSLASADEVLLNDPLVYTSYEIPLVYDGAKDEIVLGGKATSSYVLVSKTYVSPKGGFESPFLGISVGPKEKINQRFAIPRPEFQITGEKTTYSVPAPYFPAADRIDIYKGSKKLFSIDISNSRLCVEDGMCFSDAGENTMNCPSDCTTLLPASKPSIQPPPKPQPTVTPGALPPRANVVEPLVSSEKKDVSRIILSGILFVLGMASFVFWLYLRRRNR